MTKDVQRSCQDRTMSTMKITTSSIDNRNVLNFKQKHRKTEKSILFEQEPATRLLIREIWVPVRERGRSVPYPGTFFFEQIPLRHQNKSLVNTTGGKEIIRKPQE